MTPAGAQQASIHVNDDVIVFCMDDAHRGPAVPARTRSEGGVPSGLIQR
jgi:hypothetical protein